MRSIQSFLFHVGTLIGVFLGLFAAALAAICAVMAHWYRRAVGRPDPVHVVLDQGDSQEWSKTNGSNSPVGKPAAK